MEERDSSVTMEDLLSTSYVLDFLHMWPYPVSLHSVQRRITELHLRTEKFRGLESLVHSHVALAVDF